MQIDKMTLDNGLETLFVHSEGQSAGTVQMWFRAGSSLENPSNRGIAHFLEHMFFKGTPKRPGAQLAYEVESFGGEINAFTSFDYTCYYINTPCEFIEDTVEILMDMVANPTFLEEDIVPERGVVFEEFRRSLDNPNHFAFQRIQTKFFSSPYNSPILGNEKTIKSFSKEQLIEFRKNFYNLENSLFIVAGDLKNKDKLKTLINNYKLPNGEKSQFPKMKFGPKFFTDIHQKETRMCQLNLLIPSCHYSEDISASEDLAINCFGHGESSKMYRDMVIDSSLCNNASASTMFLSNGGAHFIKLVFPPKNFKKVTKKIYQAIDHIIKEGISSEELQKIKNQYVSSKVYDKETIESFTFGLGHSFAQSGNINSEDEFLEKIKQSTLSEVNKSFQEIFSREIYLGLQIPKEQKPENFKKDLDDLHKVLSKYKKVATKKVTYKALKKSKYDPLVKVIGLKRGINLVYRYNNLAPTSVFHAYVKGGLTEETPQNNGAYNLISSMITKGYKGKNEEQIRKELEFYSASLNGFSGKNAYGLTQHCQTTDFNHVLEICLNSLFAPLIPGKILEHEKEMTLRTLENQKEDPISQCFKIVNEIMFPNHPYAQNILGTAQVVKKFTAAKIKNIHLNNIKNKEIIFTYCGDLSEEKLLDKLVPFLTDIKGRPVLAPPLKAYTPLEEKVIHLPFDREQTQIFVGIPSAKLGEKENIYLKMLTTFLSGQSSELFVEVRDKQGLCYTAQPINFTALEGGYWGIYMASGHDKVVPAVSAINTLLDKIKNNGISVGEFERIKKMIRGQALLNIQTNEDYANLYSIPILQGLGMDYFYKNNEIIENLNHEEFNKAIHQILSRKRNTVVVGREIKS